MSTKIGVKKEENVARPTQITVILCLAAGDCLVYLASGLLQEFLKSTGGGKMIQPGYATLLGATGAFLAGWSLKKFIRGEHIKYGKIPDDEEEEQTED